MALVGNLSGSGGVSNTIGITGSLIIANPGLESFPTFPGSDVALFVSGNIASKPATSPNLSVRGTTVFGGDVVISGTLFGGSPLHIGTFLSASQGAEIGGAVTFTSNTAPIFNNGLSGSLTKLADGTSYLIAGTNVTIVTGTNGAVTISSTAAGGGGSNFFLDTAGAGKIYTTASSVAFPFGEAGIDEAADKGTNVHFYVSGSTDGLKTALFGGDVVTSGSVTVRDNTSAISIGYGPSTGVGQITSLNGNLVLDTVGGSRVIVDTDLEVAGTNIYAGGGGGARNIFTDNDTPAKLITIGGVGGKTTVAGGLEVTGNYISGSAGVNLTLGSSGDVAVAGALTVTGNDIKSSTATVFTLAGADVTTAGKLTVTGDLTVNGTTTTIDTTNLLVEDPLILVSKGTLGGSGTNRNGGIAIFSGSSDAAALGARSDLVFGRVANDTWGAGKFNTANGTNTNVTTMVLVPVRSSKLEVGGTSAFITSSLGTNLTAQSSGLATLKSSGAGINLDTNSTIDILFGGTQSGTFTGTGGTSLSLIARDTGPGSAGNSLTLSGSSVTIGSHTQTTTFTSAGNNIAALETVGATGTKFGASPGRSLTLSGSSNIFQFQKGTSSGAIFQVGTATPTTILQISSGSTNKQTVIDVNPAVVDLVTFITAVPTIEIAGNATTVSIAHTRTAAQTLNLGTGVTSTGNTKTVNLGTGGAAGSTTNINLGSTSGGTVTSNMSIIPASNNAYDLGRSDRRWRNMYTGDLHLKNERGDWTIIEEEEYLTITNNKNGKRYKFCLEEI